MAGSCAINSGNGENMQYLLAKIDGVNGNQIWADTSGIDAAGDNEVFFSTPIVTNNNDIMIVGAHELPNSGVSTEVLKYNQDGDKLWEREFNQYGGLNQNYFYDIHQTFDDGFIICGNLTNLTAFESPIWAVKLDSMGCEVINCSVGVENDLLQTSNSVSIYPNPTSNYLTIESDLDYHTINIYNLSGKLVKTAERNSQILVSDLSKGMYFIQLVADKNVITKKFTIE